MKIFLGSIFALLFVISSNITEYSNNQLEFPVDYNSQYGYSSNDFDATVSPFQNHVHHNLGVDFQEKNEKFKKFNIQSQIALVNFRSFPKEVNKFESFYFSKYIIPSVSKNILLETFRI